MADTPLLRARQDRNMTKSQVIRRLKKVAEDLKEPLFVSDESINRQMRFWEYGNRPVPEQYRNPFCALYDLSPAELGFVEVSSSGVLEAASEISDRVAFSEVDRELKHFF